MNTRHRIDAAIENIKNTMKELSNSLKRSEEQELRRRLDEKPIQLQVLKTFLDGLSDKNPFNIIEASLQKTYSLLRVLIVNDEETIQPHLDEIEEILQNRDRQRYVDGCQEVARKFYTTLLSGNSTLSLLTGTTDSAPSNNTTVADASITTLSDVDHHEDRGLSAPIDSDDENERAEDEIKQFKKSSSCCFGFFGWGRSSKEPLLLDTQISDSRIVPKRV